MFALRRTLTSPAIRRCGGTFTARYFASSSAGDATTTTTTTPADDMDVDLPSDAATVVQGPSLLTSTSVHRPSPSLFHLPGLRSLPFWTAPSSSNSRNRVAYNDPTVSSIVNRLESSYDTIKAEYMSAVVGSGTQTDPDADAVAKPLEPDYDVNAPGGEHATDALHTGSWDWHSYVLSGERQGKFAEHCPTTAAIVDELQEKGQLFETPFSFCFFSTLQGNSVIKAHVGPMNLRLRIHLPLIVPASGDCGLRVGSQVRWWEEGRALVLDDSYEHEVWNKTDSVRVLLLLDVWHPDVTPTERERICNMFEHAKNKGWIGKQQEEQEQKKSAANPALNVV